MNYKYLDMASYKRKDHFDYFCSLAYPYVGTTVNVEITGLIRAVKEKKLPFFLTFCYCVSNAANKIPEFRQRIEDGKIVEFENCKTSHTVALEDGTYCYCTLDGNLPFHDYLPCAIQLQELAKKKGGLEEDGGTADKFFISTLPWFSYVSFIQPVPMPADSNPRITWGKYSEENGIFQIPVSVLCHHALVDGIHIAGFYQALKEQILSVSENIRSI